MEDLPSNSRNSRGAEEKKIEKITSGEVKRVRKPLHRRLIETFAFGDPKQVAQQVLFEVLVPAAKDLAADAFNQMVDRYLFSGDSRPRTSRGYSRPSGSGGYVSYNRFSSQSSAPQRRDDDRGRPSRSAIEIDDLYTETRAEAREVIDRMFDIVDRYRQATVHDLYELMGISPEPIHHKWGWTDMQGSSVRQTSRGYLLVLPDISPLK